MNKTYEFSTFQEFFDRIPADRMAACFSEMAISFSLAKNTLKVLNEIGVSMGHKDAFRGALFSKPFKLEDDGKGEIKTFIEIPGSEKCKRITLSAKMKPEVKA